MKWVRVCASQKTLNGLCLHNNGFYKMSSSLLDVPNFSRLFLANFFLNLLNYFHLVNQRYGLYFLQGCSNGIS